MVNPFDTARMAAGYAHWRPPVHDHVMDRIHARTAREFNRALDVGCGAGVSTAALRRIASRRTGIEPSHAMLRVADAPGATFAVGRAEALPVQSQTFDLLTAAGSLNWADLDLFFAEAGRVLHPNGQLIIYDFGQGKDRGVLGDWEAEFKRLYPSPPCREITMSTLDLPGRGWLVDAYEEFSVGLRLAEHFYVEYAMTETNVADAISRGVPELEIRDWCQRTLHDVFQGDSREVLFMGFIAYARR